MPGVNNTKRIPCARNPKDHGHHPQNDAYSPDGRVGTFLWTIPSGMESAIALDGVYGTCHIHPKQLRPE